VDRAASDWAVKAQRVAAVRARRVVAAAKAWRRAAPPRRAEANPQRGATVKVGEARTLAVRAELISRAQVALKTPGVRVAREMKRVAPAFLGRRRCHALLVEERSR